jgi:PAS domain S-box-containing protein
MPTKSLDHFRTTFFQQTDLAMAVLDASGLLLDCNEAAEQLLAFDRGDAIGKSALLFRRPEDARKLELLLKRTVRERRTVDLETWVVRSDGGEVPVALNACPLSDARGEVNAVGVVLRDRTRYQALQKRLAEHDKMVAVGRLAGGMSHHINNILAAVSARVEMALATRDATAARRALILTAESVDRLSTLTRNLLIHSGAEQRPATTCQAAAVARRMVAHVRMELSDAAVHLAGTIVSGGTVRLDGQDLQQVMANLIHNARDAIGGEGTIRVDMRAETGDIVLTVRDSGDGIAEADMSHVFEPFWTTRGSLAGGTGGALGLGLTVVRGLVLAAGGTIEINSAPGEGTTVSVRLPEVAEPSPSGAERPGGDKGRTP